MKKAVWIFSILIVLFIVACKDNRVEMPAQQPLNLSCQHDPLSGYPELNNDSLQPVYACDAIPAEKDRAQCFQEILGELFNSTEPNINFCDAIADNEAFFRCYLGFAQIKRDPCICGNIPELFENTPELRAGCYLYSAIQFKEERICDKIQGAEQKIENIRANCLERIGRLKKSPEICKQVLEIQGNSDRSDTCLMYVAKSSKAAMVCNDILNSSLQEKCYLQIAVETKNETLCSKTADPLLLQSCHSIIEETIKKEQEIS